METKQVNKIKVMKFSTKATLKDLNQYTGAVPNRLKEKAMSLGLFNGEPQIWQYNGSDGNPETEFQLDICVPVSAFVGDPGEFSFDELPSVRCLCETHKGAWSEMGHTYKKMIGEMMKNSWTFTGILERFT